MMYAIYSYEAVSSDDLKSYYSISDPSFYVSGHPLLLIGKGNHQIGLGGNGIDCFNFTFQFHSRGILLALAEETTSVFAQTIQSYDGAIGFSTREVEQTSVVGTCG